MRHYLLIVLVLVLVTGCATPPPTQSHFTRPDHLFPENGFVTQRAVLTIHGRQFPLNGYLALSATGGKRLVVTENFGHVLADVLVKPDGTIFVMQSTRMFPAKYIRRCLAPDLECVVGGSTDAKCPVTMVEANHFIIRHFAYTVDLRILGVKPGAQSAALFDASKAEAK